MRRHPGRVDPFFVVGCPRSGTTLLSVMLDRHSQLAVTPETAFYEEIASKLPTKDLRKVLGSWPRLADLGLDVDDVIRGLPPAALSRQVLGRLLELYGRARGKPRVGEKTPQHLWRVPGILDDFEQAKIICLLRDGRDVALSLHAMPWWTRGLAGAAQLWLGAVEQAGDYTARFGGRFMTVRYEALVVSPQRSMEAVMGFLGLEFEAAQLRPSPSPVVRERSLAWKGRALGEIEASRVESWRSAAAPTDLAVLHALLAPTLRHLGYPAPWQG